MTKHPWTLADCADGDDLLEQAHQIIMEALEDSEFFDWIEQGDAMSFSPETAAMIERAMKDAHRERKVAARAALRRLLNTASNAIDEVRTSLEPV